MHDIGILASTDPVALDQACVDLVYEAEDGGSLVTRMESRNGEHVLQHGEEIGLGSRSYNLVSIDQKIQVKGDEFGFTQSAVDLIQYRPWPGSINCPDTILHYLWHDCQFDGPFLFFKKAIF